MTDEELKQNERYRIYKNGAVFDQEAGRIVDMRPELAEVNTQITAANSGAMAERRRELKRQIAREAANNAIEREDYKTKYGGLAFVAAIVDAATRKATNIDDPKMIESARFVFQETGEADKQGEDPAVPLSQVRGLMREMANAARVMQPVQADEVIDVE